MGKKRSRTNTTTTEHKNKKVKLSCPCGLSGQNCIVLRRHLRDWVLEDDILKEAGLPPRKNCEDPGTDKQNKAMKDYYDNLEKQG